MIIDVFINKWNTMGNTNRKGLWIPEEILDDKNLDADFLKENLEKINEYMEDF